MNSERSQRRAWQREVAIGIGRTLTRVEARMVAEAWREHRAGRPDKCPRDFVKLFAKNKVLVNRRLRGLGDLRRPK